MEVTIVPCGPAANESERIATEAIRRRLLSAPGDGVWYLLTNKEISLDRQFRALEVDIILIGPSGVKVIEVKHWTSQHIKSFKDDSIGKAPNEINAKARVVATTLRRKNPSLPYVSGHILTTQDKSLVKGLSGRVENGVPFFTLEDLDTLVGVNDLKILNKEEVKKLAFDLEPRRSQLAERGTLRRLGEYTNLELQTPSDERYYRKYRGIHHLRQDKVILHLFDLSASKDSDAKDRASRAFEAVHSLQIYPWVPRIIETFRDVDGYDGELFFYSEADPMAPLLEKRAEDPSWTETDRLMFALEAIRAIKAIHNTGTGQSRVPNLHRNLNPKTILVSHDNRPIIIGFEYSRISAGLSVGSGRLPDGPYMDMVAPEVKDAGDLSIADYRADVYSISSSLKYIFDGQEGETSGLAVLALSDGCSEDPKERHTLDSIELELEQLLEPGSLMPEMVPPARLWTEGLKVNFKGSRYRVVQQLGEGGVGITFKVVEVDTSTEDEVDLGTYVGKVTRENMGEQTMKAYRLARGVVGETQALSHIYEIASEWKENQFTALMRWVKGEPLMNLAGRVSLIPESDFGQTGEPLAIKWISSMCEAVNVFHKNNLVHGDVSPKNIIVSESDLVLTDYDTVSRIGDKLGANGTLIYSPPPHNRDHISSASDDIYALAASFFHVLFDVEPFNYSGILSHERGLNWDEVDRTLKEQYQSLKPFLDKATNVNTAARFENGADALQELRSLEPQGIYGSQIPSSPIQLGKRNIEWLHGVLQAYPGYSLGNSETRGQDSEFARSTYVSTELEEELVEAIKTRSISLVILCGNAGDGKTALLQYVASELGMKEYKSSERILEGRVLGDLDVLINLDGAAAWEDMSADDSLDQFMEPFQHGRPSGNLVRMLAINDGRLMEWMENFKRLNNENDTELTRALYGLLRGDSHSDQNGHIRFINLNHRSLVGFVDPDNENIDSGFINDLLDKLYGYDKDAKNSYDKAKEIWEPCGSCIANTGEPSGPRCEILRAAQRFGPNSVPGAVKPELRELARTRLFDAIRTVYLKGEVHITLRDLRSAFVYILFGVDFCDHYYPSEDEETSFTPYWDRAFKPGLSGRQGEVLNELSMLDPAMNVHPKVDRILRNTNRHDDTADLPSYLELDRDSARRRAYFEWPRERIKEKTGDEHSIGLPKGKHTQEFLDLAKDHLNENTEKIQDIIKRLCKGIAKLEDLPEIAFSGLDMHTNEIVPLKVVPKTPTDTSFWVEKRLSAFKLIVPAAEHIPGLHTLHRDITLSYSDDPELEPIELVIGADLFHLLLELEDGYQLGDAATSDVFARLSIFVQRLRREDQLRIMAWNPMNDDEVYEISANPPVGNQEKQIISIKPKLSSGGGA